MLSFNLEKVFTTRVFAKKKYIIVYSMCRIFYESIKVSQQYFNDSYKLHVINNLYLIFFGKNTLNDVLEYFQN